MIPLSLVLADTTIEQPARLLYATLFAAGDGAPTGALPVTELLTRLGIRSAGALRHLRGAIAGYASTSIQDGVITWTLGARPTDAQPDAERVPQTRTEPTARPTDAQPAAERVPQTRTDPTARPTDAQPAAERVPQTRTDPPQTPPGRQVGIINLTQGDNLPTPPNPPVAEGMAARKLLRAVGVVNGTCETIVGRWSLREIATFVAVYLADKSDGRVRGAGVLKTRCTEPDAVPPWLPLTDPDWNHPLLAQHLGSAIAAWRQAEEAARYASDSEDVDLQIQIPAPVLRCKTPVITPDGEKPACDIWDAALGHLRLQLPRGTFETWVRDTTCLAYAAESDTLTIGAANAAAKDWLSLRLRPLITRTLAGIIGRTVTITIEAPSCQTTTSSPGCSAAS